MESVCRVFPIAQCLTPMGVSLAILDTTVMKGSVLLLVCIVMDTIHPLDTAWAASTPILWTSRQEPASSHCDLNHNACIKHTYIYLSISVKRIPS